MREPHFLPGVGTATTGFPYLLVNWAKCAITGATLEISGCTAHHIIPVNMGGGDSYSNLLFVTTLPSTGCFRTGENPETIAHDIWMLWISLREQFERLDDYHWPV